jgi:RNase H-fold protein (predicted Holliday junction resolvase)
VTEQAVSPDNPLAALPASGKLLGLDLGTKTIGVAVSDGLRYSATPLETIARKKFTADAERLMALIAENAAVVDKMAAAYILQGALDRLGRLGPQDAEDEDQYD